VKLSDFDFTLPEHLIAQHPLPERDGSKMMVVRRAQATWEHRVFRELPEILSREFCMVLNNTKVFPARLRAHRPGRRENIEILLIREVTSGNWLSLVKPGRKAPQGQELEIDCLRATVVGITESGARLLRFPPMLDLMAHFDRLGEPPLPPYIHRKDGWDPGSDRLRYQTIYAGKAGSVAAPTAGLHFSQEVLNKIDLLGIPRSEILLHVGYGTFQPIRFEEIERHRIEPEYFEVSDAAAGFIGRQKADGRKVLAVGTTTTRVLEYLARDGITNLRGQSGHCDLFIYPGYEFRVINSLLTNFHLPRSSLFILAAAFAGRELMLECYREAIACDYRFYSYGDCMLIL
jgi:S-adenosylmethionine:tRNA ribosyltransferase-isomerase